MNNRVNQNIPSPSEIRLPNAVVVSSEDEVKQRTPIRKTIKAMKKACTYINCRLMWLTLLNSTFHLKYLGKITCSNARSTNRTPINLRCSSIFFKNECCYERSCFYFLGNFKSGIVKGFHPCCF